MNKVELVKALAEKTGYSQKDLKVAVESLFDVIAETIATGEAVSIPGFGKFDLKYRAARTCRNPQTGETMDVAARKSPHFNAALALKKTVNE